MTVLLYRSDSSSQYWMGAVRDPQVPDNWKWVKGNDVTVSFWNAPGGNGDCARFDGSKGWLWADTDCKARMNYICQHRKFFFIDNAISASDFFVLLCELMRIYY